MTRFLAGALASFLLLTGAFLLWQSRAERSPGLPPAPPRRQASILAAAQPMPALEAPEASPKSREEKRFTRADKDILPYCGSKVSPRLMPICLARTRSTLAKS